jgi:hypothetical protein
MHMNQIYRQHSCGDQIVGLPIRVSKSGMRSNEWNLNEKKKFRMNEISSKTCHALSLKKTGLAWMK